MVQMEQTISKVYGRSGPRLAKLRTADPERNLRERWKVLAERDLQGHVGFVPMILESGWAVVAIPEDKVAYTVGLDYRFGHPELLISAPHLELQEQKCLLDTLATYVSVGNKIRAGEPVEVDGGREFTFGRYLDATFDKLPCGYLARFEELFTDKFHTAGGTLPVLWTELAPPRAKSKKKKKKPKPKKKPTAKPAKKVSARSRAT